MWNNGSHAPMSCYIFQEGISHESRWRSKVVFWDSDFHCGMEQFINTLLAAGKGRAMAPCHNHRGLSLKMRFYSEFTWSRTTRRRENSSKVGRVLGFMNECPGHQSLISHKIYDMSRKEVMRRISLLIQTIQKSWTE